MGRSFRLIAKRVWALDVFSSHVLIPAGILTFYLVSLSRLLPEGVNNVFVTRSGKYMLAISILLYLAFFAFIGIKGARRPFFRTSGEDFSAGDVTLVLLPLAPVIQYILRNRDILSPFDSILVIIVFALFIALLVFVIPALFRKAGSNRTAMFLGLAVVFSITNMASLSRQFVWHGVGSLKVQLPVFAGVFLLSWFLFHSNKRNLLYVLIAGYFLTNSIVQLSVSGDGSYGSGLVETDNRLVAQIGSRGPATTPNIYLLIYDAYVINETMLAYGIDNSQQEQFLRDLYFQVYPRTYSVAASSNSTMSRVLNASVEYYGSQRRGVSGDGVVQNLLRDFGYRTYGVFKSDYFFRGIVPSYDQSFPGYGSSARLLVKAILEGEFRFDIEIDKVTNEQFLAEKRSIFSDMLEDPKFVYTHSFRPGHSKLYKSCTPNEVDLFAERLSSANVEMRQDVEAIIENDPEAIVIIAGDHGPYLTKNCGPIGDSSDISEISRLDIQDRYGTFLAIRWPTADFGEFDDITVLQDLFPAVFAYIFQDPSLLESKVEPTILNNRTIGNAELSDGVIRGGIHSGEPLFVGENDR